MSAGCSSAQILDQSSGKIYLFNVCGKKKAEPESGPASKMLSEALSAACATTACAATTKANGDCVSTNSRSWEGSG